MEYVTSVSKRISRAKPIINKGRAEETNNVIRQYLVLKKGPLIRRPRR